MRLSDQELQELLNLAKHATPRPWYVRHLDDSHAMNLTAISTSPDTVAGERWPDFNSGEIVEATLIQEPRYVDVSDGKWDENAAYITAAANHLTSLGEEVIELRRERVNRQSTNKNTD
jgi:hypothetical protein